VVRSWEKIVWILVFVMAVAVAVGVLGAREAEAAVGEAAVGEITVREAAVREAVATSAALVDAIRLSEILAGPARDWDGDGVFDAKNDEWVEVENRSGAVVALDGYRVADADTTIRYAFSGTLAVGAVLLVTGSQAVAWQRSVGRTTSGLSLNNAGDTVFLLRVAGADTTIVDEHTYGSIEGASDRSTGRADSASDAWVLFDALNRYTGSGTPAGTGCPPTPGGPNGCTTEVGMTTWGAIKRLYR